MTLPEGAATLFRFGAAVAPRRRLLCVPFAGGGVGAFRSWMPHLSEDVELLAVQLPGRESRLGERPLDDIKDMARAIQPAIAAASDLPYAIFGHSMGALVAFELTLSLEAHDGRAPSHLFVSARRSPDEPSTEPPVHALPEPEFLDELQRRYGAVPDAVRREPDLLALLVPTLRADIRAIETYAFGGDRKVQCPLHVYGGLEDQHPRPSQLGGWQRVAARDVRVRLFAGDHFYLNAQRDALTADIAAQWVDDLARVERA